MHIIYSIYSLYSIYGLYSIYSINGIYRICSIYSIYITYTIWNILYLICYMLYFICYIKYLIFYYIIWNIYIRIYIFCSVCTIINSIPAVLVYLFKRGFTCVSKRQWSFLCRWLLFWAAFCSSIYVNYNSSTKVRVRRYNVIFLKTVMQEFSLYVSPIWL